VSANKNNISQIRKYLNGELDARAMHELERQALDDPFLADALEGYEQRGNQEQHLSDLQNRLQHRIIPTKKRLTLWPALSIAASVLLFIAVGGWWLFNSRSAGIQSELAAPDKTIVKNQPVMPAVKAPLPKPDSAVLKPASPEDLMIAGNGTGSVGQKTPAKAYAPALADVAATPQAESVPAQSLRADDVASYMPERDQRLMANNAKSTKGVPAGSPEIRIRGLSSPTSKEPLYVVDGKVYNGKLTDFDVKDIEALSVLKDASATAVYGAKGAGGVIVLTTKPGSAARLKSDSAALLANRLADVVIVGYGAQRRASVVGAISSVKPVELNQALQGTLAGIDISGAKKSKALKILKTVTGKVVDKDGLPLPGVSVAVAGKSQKAQTDINGKFNIKATEKDELTLAYIGYETKQLKIKGKDSLNVTMNSSGAALSEVVVVGYGSRQEVEEQAARPQNGWSELNKYLKQNAKPVNGKTGVVRLSFVVNTDGSLTDFKVLKSLSPEADQAAIQLIKEGTTWLPNTNREPETVRLRIKFQ
jgi:TonB family protein